MRKKRRERREVKSERERERKEIEKEKDEEEMNTRYHRSMLKNVLKENLPTRVYYM